MIKQLDANSVSLPRQKFETKGTTKDRIYCQICLVVFVAKNQAKRKLEKISGDVNFKEYAEKWKNKAWKYNKVFSLVDWQNSFFLSGFSCTKIHDTRDSRGRGRLSL